MKTVHALAQAALVALLAAAPLHAVCAQQPKKPKPITREWHCDNGRIVLVNYHPIRIREPAWLTYLGNRVAVQRKRVDRGVAATSADGRVEWQENGTTADLEFKGLLDQPLHCEAKGADGAAKGTSSSKK